MINASIWVLVPNLNNKTPNEEIWWIIALFLFLLLGAYLIKFIYKIIINFKINLPKESNIFEIIFYSKIFGPFLNKNEKEKITKTKKGRIWVILYPIIYLIIWWIILFIWVEERLSDDELTILSIFILLGVIPYNFILPLCLSIYKYIIWK